MTPPNRTCITTSEAADPPKEAQCGRRRGWLDSPMYTNETQIDKPDASSSKSTDNDTQTSVAAVNARKNRGVNR